MPISTIRIAGLVNDSITDGPGLRLTVFAQGCNIRCPNCHNPETHDHNQGYDITIDEIMEAIRANPLLTGVTFSGGEPTMQAEAFAALASRIRSELPHLNILTYTGHTIDELLALHCPHVRDLIKRSDYIIDGRFEEGKKSYDLDFRGSSNQNLIVVKDM
ncbi:MAG: anaerobic ribonucleoside-triphosphate reductase activating protein [Defluviitaleaceae bacterium]|nr:anaerobic ribonucleoside-triphosphate reductase activating protein [Defluviitaleaceae bacterium]